MIDLEEIERDVNAYDEGDSIFEREQHRRTLQQHCRSLVAEVRELRTEIERIKGEQKHPF